MIRSLGLAIAAAVMMAAAPLTALAAPAPAAPDLTVNADQHTQGKKEAPDALKAANFPCSITDAYYLGSSQTKDDAGKPATMKLYEVVCQGALGQIIQYVPGGTTRHFDCIAVTGTPNIRCRLPGNVDVKATVSSFVTSAGRTCTVSDYRYVGGTPAGDSYYEVGCTGALGFVVKHAADNSNSALECGESGLECKFTSAEALKAADKAVIEKLVAGSGKTCQVKDSKSLGSVSGGGKGYEVACTDNTGYMLISKADGTLAHAYPCANAENILGGCKLTDAVVAQTQEAATYTKLAKASGFDCAVAKYRFVGVDTKNNEVVELACSNRPDGGVAQFPSDNTPGHVYDCVHAGLFNQSCKLTDPSAVYGRYTQALAAKGKGTCKVSNAHYAGHYAQENTDLIETACSDGLPGWVIEMDASGQVKSLMGCKQAAAANAKCVLPGNPQ